jgi:hypothetical protein
MIRRRKAAAVALRGAGSVICRRKTALRQCGHATYIHTYYCEQCSSNAHMRDRKWLGPLSLSTWRNLVGALILTTAFSIRRVHCIPLPVCPIQFAANLPVLHVNDSKTGFVLSLKIIPKL